MKKQMKTLVILASAVVLLLAVYVIVKGIQTKKAEQESAANTAVYLYEPEVITELVLTNAHGTYDYVYDQTSRSWGFAGHEEYEIDKTTMDEFANELIQSQIVREIEIVASLKDFGLETPVYTLQATDGTGETHTFCFGNQSGDGENYYVMRDGGNVIYNVKTSIIRYLEYTLTDYVSYTMPEAVEEAELNSLTLTRNGVTCVIEKETTESKRTIKGLHGQDMEVTDYSYAWKVKDADASWTVSGAAYEDAMAAVVESLTSTGVHANACVAYDPDASEEKVLGLDAPSCVIALDCTGTEQDWTLQIGGNNVEYWANGNYKSGGYYGRIGENLAVVSVTYKDMTAYLDLMDVIFGQEAE